uniref:Uncharacterized protein n=1 Tax=Streptomyces sp. NBC_00008 TaxID=2903610 RepID=A0AAU2VZI4_9ACTN
MRADRQPDPEHPVIDLSGPPEEDWSAATVHGVFGVHVLWRTPQHGWDGHDVDSALGGDRV